MVFRALFGALFSVIFWAVFWAVLWVVFKAFFGEDIFEKVVLLIFLQFSKLFNSTRLK